MGNDVSRLILMGRIIAPFGIKGWVKIHSFVDDPLSWLDIPEWWLSPDDTAPFSSWNAVECSDLIIHNKQLLLKLAHIHDRTAAEAIHHFYIGAPRHLLPETAEDEYYWGDLIGCQVINQQNQSLGIVHSLLETGVHAVLSCQDHEEKEHLIPFIKKFILNVDLQQQTILVDWQNDW